jgi:hypothetical protein
LPSVSGAAVPNFLATTGFFAAALFPTAVLVADFFATARLARAIHLKRCVTPRLLRSVDTGDFIYRPGRGYKAVTQPGRCARKVRPSNRTMRRRNDVQRPDVFNCDENSWAPQLPARRICSTDSRQEAAGKHLTKSITASTPARVVQRNLHNFAGLV